MNPTVVALLVSHDGARWLPAVIDGLRSADRRRSSGVVVRRHRQPRRERRPPRSTPSTRCVTVSGRDGVPRGGADSGSSRSPPRRGRSGSGCCTTTPTRRPTRSSACSPRPPPTRPPTCSARSCASGRRSSACSRSASPSPGTGRRETGLEAGEYDQGQHDEVRQVLAVNTAGMLVRRRVYDELGGLDDHLPIFGNDLDFGWRAAAAGHRTARGPAGRRLPRRGRPPRRPADAAHRPPHPLPGAPGRAVHAARQRPGPVACRGRPCASSSAPCCGWSGSWSSARSGEALDDLAALFSVYVSPGEIRRARQARRTAGEPRPRAAARAVVGALPARPRLRRRHRRRRDQPGAGRRRPAPGRRRRPRRPPAAPARRRRPTTTTRWPRTRAGRTVLHQPAGGRAGASSWCSRSSGSARRSASSPAAAWLRRRPTRRRCGSCGSSRGTRSAPAPPYPRRRTSLPMAVLGSVLGNSAAAAVSALLLLAVPLALWGAWRLLRVVGRLVDPGGSPRWLVALGAVTYALVPVTSGAWGDGRLGVVAAAVPAVPGSPRRPRLLRPRARPALARGLAHRPAPRRSPRPSTPVAWVFAVVLGRRRRSALAVAVTRSLPRDREVWGPPLVALGVAPVLLAPWWLPALWHGAGSLLLMETGRQPYPLAVVHRPPARPVRTRRRRAVVARGAAGGAGRAGADPARDPDPGAGRLAGRGRRGAHRHRRCPSSRSRCPAGRCGPASR